LSAIGHAHGKKGFGSAFGSYFCGAVNLTPFAIALTLVCTGCVAPDTSGVKLIGHGGLGSGSELPLDSRESLETALTLGMDGVELDVQLTADSVLVAFHDLQLSGANGCSGVINDFAWKDLEQCPLAIVEDRSYPIVAVDGLLLDLAKKYPSAEFTLDVKLNTKGNWWSYLHSYVRAIRRLNAHESLQGKLLVECKNEDFLRTMHNSLNQVPLFLYTEQPAKDLSNAASMGCLGITVHMDLIDLPTAVLIRQAGLQLTLFGVDGPWAMRSALAMEPERLQVDR